MTSREPAKQPPGVDLPRLRSYLDRAEPGLVTGDLCAELIAGGHSNLTYRLTDGTHRWVLRRPPLGHVLATAHDMNRECRVMSALAATCVPVPRTVHLCTGPDVLGAPFYLMEQVDGVVLRTLPEVEALGASSCETLAYQLADVLADLHQVDVDSVGLADFGRPHGYLRRQVARWRTQLDASASRVVAGFDELHARLAGAVPDSPRAALLHGDYRLDNVLVDPTRPRINAVLDWEMAALGDPLADLALFAVYSRRRGGTDGAAGDPVTGGVTGAPGFPTVDDLVSRYARRTGTDVSNLDWYLALAYFKLAVVLEGIHYRFTQGKTVGAGFEQLGAMVPALVNDGLAALKGQR